MISNLFFTLLGQRALATPSVPVVTIIHRLKTLKRVKKKKAYSEIGDLVSKPVCRYGL
jgi:hypothetical protein